ncbi:CHAP domain-containing protein [Bizionia myxarmorum]|uniref:CHAP domain-containing protein n=1 Tax=Bizionia myxarmorum TaxID=291186 RepID=A0A5D0R5F9_9FLAO|nr:CHAP domain-containing protein [Bizionia myxarmorum]TYB76165.1 CHAP domain-containing protein [Bizionia myxarmorum]
MKKRIILIVAFLALTSVAFYASGQLNLMQKYEIGEEVDSLNGVAVYYNGSVGHVKGRRVTKDGYNLGLKFQCVEFVKRYYYEHLNHKMPDSYGHAKSFFNPNIKDGQINKQRNLTQFSNPSQSKPSVNDLIVYKGTPLNSYGHVSIISKVKDNEIEIIQQNPDPFASSRETFKLINDNGTWRINNNQILGWLRK